MTATDSVLEALLPQLNGHFDRTLLLVIADRCDELAEGNGEGWRVLHEYQRQPTPYREVCYWSLLPPYCENLVHRLPQQWLDRVFERRDVTMYTKHDIGKSSVSDFSSYALAYRVAAEEWLKLNQEQKQKALEELK